MEPAKHKQFVKGNYVHDARPGSEWACCTSKVVIAKNKFVQAYKGILACVGFGK
jgi:hypothetical protein